MRFTFSSTSNTLEILGILSEGNGCGLGITEPFPIKIIEAFPFDRVPEYLLQDRDRNFVIVFMDLNSAGHEH